MGLIALLLGGLAIASCADPPEDGRASTDRQAYLAAMRAGPGPGRCDTISAPTLHGECIALAGLTLARRGEPMAALSICAELQPGPWRDECYFLVADGLEVRGETARAICESAGEWRFQCLGHAINRESILVWEQLGIGREDEVQQRVLEITSRYIGGREAGERTRRWMVTRVAARDLERPFSKITCGQVEPSLCRDAYIERVKLVTQQINAAEEGDRSWRLACARRVSATRAAQLDLPTWEPSVDELVQEAWQQLCQR